MSQDIAYWYLKDHQLFRNLSIAEIKQLCIITRFKHCKKNEKVELDFSGKPRVFLLKKGIIKLSKIDDNGEEVIKDLLHQGDLFGALEFTNTDNKDSEFIEVLSTEAFMCTFYREDLEKIILAKPEFALSYIKFMGFRLKQMKNSYNNIFFKDAKTRFYLLLQSFLEKETNITTQEYALPNYLTQKDMAQLICTTRQTVINLIQELEKDNIIAYSQKNIIIKNIPALTLFCNNVR